MNGNLSTNAAVFQITKYNARTANADGTFSPTGTVRVKGVRVGAAGRITPEWQVFAGYAYLDARIIQGITNIGGVGNTTGMQWWMRPGPSRPCAISKPLPSPRIRFAAGTRTLSNVTSAWPCGASS